MSISKSTPTLERSSAGQRRRNQGDDLAKDRVASVVESLKEMFKDGTVSESAQLPSERELALQLGISRRILRRGLDRLEASGQIWRHHGKGTFIGDKPPPLFKDLRLADSASNPMEVMEARLELESYLASLAAVRATTDEVRHITWCLERSKSATDLETFELWDRTLHRAVAEAAHNALLLTLYDVVNVARDQSFWGKLQHHAINRCGLGAIWLQHKAFVDAIASRDPIEARRCTHQHILTVRANMFDVEGGDRSPEKPLPMKDGI